MRKPTLVPKHHQASYENAGVTSYLGDANSEVFHSEAEGVLDVILISVYFRWILQVFIEI